MHNWQSVANQNLCQQCLKADTCPVLQAIKKHKEHKVMASVYRCEKYYPKDFHGP